MGSRELPLPTCYELLLGKGIAKKLDVQGHGIPATVASTTYIGMNALHAAGGLGRLPVYQYLVEEVKMDIEKPDTAQDFTPLEHAVKHGHLPAVRYLLDHGADLHQRRSKGNITLLHAAAIHGQYEIVKFLLSKGVDVDAISDLGTALTLAALKGYASTVKILLQHNADPNKGGRLVRPLRIAVHKSAVSCVKLLIQAVA